MYSASAFWHTTAKRIKREKERKGGFVCRCILEFSAQGVGVSGSPDQRPSQHIDDNATPDIGLGRVIAAITLPATAAAAVETAEPAA
jgi:hypothetical protein